VALDRDGQYEVGGLLMGPTTGYVVDTVLGLGGIPEIRTVDRPKSHDHGGWAGTDLLEPREIVMAVGLDGELDASAYETLITNLGAVMRPRSDEMAFRYKRFGRIRRLGARPRGFILPWDDDFYLGAGRAALRFQCPDPVIYSDETDETGPSSGTFPVTNDGNFPIWPVVETAAGGDITLTNATTDETVELLDLSGAAVIDFAARTVFVGTSDEYAAVQPSPDWWKVQPGLNSLTFSASATITFRHGWATG